MRRLSCTRVQRRLLAARDGGVALAERLELDLHLSQCALCRAFDARDAALDQALALVPEPPVERLDLEARVRAVRVAIEQRALAAAARRARLLRTAAFAAALLLLASLVVALARRAPQPRRELVGQPPAEPGAGTQRAERGDGPAPGPSEAPLDLGRIELARQRARAALAAAADPASTTPERLARLDLELAGLRGEGWPVARLVERHLDAGDAAVAGLAARWLGRAGERLALAPIAALLRDPRAGGELRAEALEALIELGYCARPILLAALDDAPLRPRALAALLALGGADLAGDLRRALVGDATLERDFERDRELCAALLALGEDGVDALVQVAAEPSSVEGLALATLERSDSARAQLAARLEQRAPQSERAARLRVAARLGLAGALSQLLDAALDREQRAAALTALCEYRGSGAWAVLVDLWVSGRVPEGELLAAARLRLVADALEVGDVIALAALRSDRAGLDAQLDMLLAVDSGCAAPALVQLAGCGALERDQRQWAALALVEVGAAQQLEGLSMVLRELAPEDLRLAAACAFALHALGGPAALEQALGPASLALSRSLAALFAARPTDRNRAVTLSRASRLIEPWLDPLNPERPRTDL